MSLSRRQLVAEQIDLAQAALRAGLTEAAAVHVRQALALEPANAVARLLEARVRLRLSQPRQALAALDSHDLYHPDHRAAPEVALLRAASLIRCGATDLALSLLRRLTAELPDDVRPHRMLAQLCVQLGDAAAAVASLEHVLRLEPSDDASRRTLVQLLSRNNPQRAIDVLLAAPHSLNHAGDRLRLARLLYRAGRDREAAEAYAALLLDHPDEAIIWREAGVLADAHGDRIAALHRLRQAVVLDPNDASARVLLALAHMHAGEFLVAGHVWWRINRDVPDHTQSLAGMLVCALAEGRERLVRRLRSRLETLTSRNERQRMLADLWLHAASGITIRTALHGATAAPAGSPLEGLLRTAADRFESHTLYFPGRADAHYHLASCRHALGEPEADVALDAALRLNPRYAAASRLQEKLHRAA